MERAVDAAQFAHDRHFTDSQRARAARLNGHVPYMRGAMMSGRMGGVSARVAGAMCPEEEYDAMHMDGDEDEEVPVPPAAPEPVLPPAPLPPAPPAVVARATPGPHEHATAPTARGVGTPATARGRQPHEGHRPSGTERVCVWKAAYTAVAIGVLLYVVAYLCRDAARGPRIRQGSR